MKLSLRIIISFLLLNLFFSPDTKGCTSAIVGARSSAVGRPMVWKHRDTGTEHNFIERVDGKNGNFTYVALFNGGDSLLRDAWMGMNEAGLMIMNTASYNLAPDTAKIKDREGEVMRRALEVCITVDDFRNLLDTLPKPLGVQANFGLIDINGNGGYFETDDYSYTPYLLSDTVDVIVRTNFSFSGNDIDGFGYIRYDNANNLMGEAPYSPWLFTENLSRSFFHSFLGKDFSQPDHTGRWVVDQDFIPRRSSAASIVMVGGSNPEDYLMFVTLGYPPVGTLEAVTLDNVPENLRPTEAGFRAKACNEAVERKHRAFPVERGSGPNYIDMEYLQPENAARRAKNLETYRKYFDVPKD